MALPDGLIRNPSVANTAYGVSKVKEVRKAIVAVSLIAISAYLAMGHVFQGQQPPAKPGSKESPRQKDEIIELESNLLTIDVIATDANGNFVRDLKQTDFQLLEDNRAEKIE